jgi:hypothetical protein
VAETARGHNAGRRSRQARPERLGVCAAQASAACRRPSFRPVRRSCLCTEVGLDDGRVALHLGQQPFRNLAAVIAAKMPRRFTGLMAC